MEGETCTAAEPWTVGRLLDWTRDHLDGHNVDDARLSAEILLAHALECSRIDLYTRFDRVPDEEQRAAFRNLVIEAAAHKPIAYLVGQKEFFSLGFEVDEHVLIPRPETETLVERAMDALRRRATNATTLLDVGTGSGCIAVTILKHLPEARVVGTDISAKALQVARRNAERHGVADRLRLVRADRLDVPDDCVPSDGFACLVSNPPYVSDDQRDTLPKNVRDFEPDAALFAGGDGLDFYRAIAERGVELLAERGSVLVEIADGHAAHVEEIFRAAGRFRHVNTWRDTVLGHQRVMEFDLVKATPRRGMMEASPPA